MIGGLYLWGADLDTMVMVDIVMAIGMTVDFSAHISYLCFINGPNLRESNKLAEVLPHSLYMHPYLSNSFHFLSVLDHSTRESCRGKYVASTTSIVVTPSNVLPIDSFVVPCFATSQSTFRILLHIS